VVRSRPRHQDDERRAGPAAGEGQPLAATELKTDKSRRQIELPDQLVRSLHAHRARQLEERLAAGPRWRDTGFVFTGIFGGPRDPRKVNKAFDRLLTLAKLPKLGAWHLLRQTCGTLLLEDGADLYAVSKRLGHSSITITADVYSHVTPNLRRAMAARMGRMAGRLKNNHSRHQKP
jgi:integrase